jgi:hypothetical protein
MKRYSESLLVADGHVHCQRCKQMVGSAQTWKNAAPLLEIKMSSVSGAGGRTSKELVLRQFSCRGCGYLLDSESALPDDPFLIDVVEEDHQPSGAVQKE